MTTNTLNGTSLSQKVMDCEARFVELARVYFESHADQTVGKSGQSRNCPLFNFFEWLDLPVNIVAPWKVAFNLNEVELYEGIFCQFAWIVDRMYHPGSFESVEITGQQALDVLEVFSGSWSEGS